MDKGKLLDIYTKIKEFDKIIIAVHKRPDGDCLGSAYGLKDIITTTWPKKKVQIAAETVGYLKFLGKPDKIADEDFKGALVISVDTAARNRIYEQRFDLGDMLIKIDHHIPVENFGDIDYVDVERPSCTLIIMDLLNEFSDKLKITKTGAQALYTGTLTDTGRFKYSGVDGDTFRSVAILYDNGLETKEIYSHLDVRTDQLTKYKGYFLQHYKKTKNGVAYINILPKHIKKFKVSLGEATSLVNELGYFDDCPIWILFAEYEGKIVRARMRSKGPAIDKLANKYDGGGHRLACGANLGTWKRSKLLLAEADLLAKQYKEEL
jgi:phosphoesterase RecJ-like protein